MAEFVVISDLHAHPWTAFARGDGSSNSRLQHNLRVLDVSLKAAHERRCPWLFAGDLIHTAGYALHTVMSGVVDVLAKYPKVPKVAVWGNHDARGTGGRIALQQTVFASLLRSVDNLTVLDPSLVGSLTLDGWIIAGAGYQPRMDLLDLGPGGDIGIFHQTVRGSQTAQGFELNEGVEPQELLKRYRVCIVGHVHHPQQDESAPKGKAILIPGSPEHQNFGDAGEHGWWIIDIPKDKRKDPEVELVPGGSPEFRSVDSADQVEDDGHYYRVRTMVPGVDLPDNATAIGPSPTMVQQRGLLRGVSGIEEILTAWMQSTPPANLGRPEDVFKLGRQLIEGQEPARLRPGRVVRMHLENFCSYEDQDIVLDDGVWLVIGKGRDYPSNGAGKSTLAGEALYWAMTGKNTKGLMADEVIRVGASEAVVTVAVRDGSTIYQITRRKGARSILEVLENDEPWEANSSDDMTEKLLKRFGLTPELWRSLGYFSQEKLLLFSTATDGERKNILADLIGLAAYQEASTAAASEAGHLYQQQAAAQSRVEAYYEQLAANEEAREKGLALSQEWTAQMKHEEAEAARVLAAAQRDLDALTVRQRLDAFASGAEVRVRRYTAGLEADRPRRHAETLSRLTATLRDQMVRNESLLEGRLKELGMDLQSATDAVARMPAVQALHTELSAGVQRAREATTKASNHHHGCTTRLQNAQRALTSAEAELIKARASSAQGICPTCNQPTKAENLAQLMERLETAVWGVTATVTSAHEAEVQAQVDLDAAIKVEQEVTARFNLTAGLLNNCVQLQSKLATINDLRSKLDDYAQQRAQLSDSAAQQVDRDIAALTQRKSHIVLRRLERLERFVKDIEQQSRARVDAAANELQIIKSMKNPHTGQIKAADELITLAQKMIKDAKDQEEAFILRAAVYEYWRKAFSRQGIQSLLMEEVATLFNQHRSSIFPVLTQGVYDVQFSTVSQTRAGDFRERTEFIVFEHGVQVPYARTSGGQRRRIDLGIMLVLVKAVSAWMGVPGVLGVLTLDEVFGFLDDSGAEGLLDALQQVQQSIPTIFAISHDAHLQSLFPNVIRVEQDESGISRIAE